MHTRLAIRAFWLALILTMPGCVTYPGARSLSGTYVHRETGGVIVFRPDGKFYYAFTTPTETPGNLGYYKFDRPTNAVPHLTLRSAHAGMFSIRVSESGDRVFLTHPMLFTTEQVYERRPDR
jgi:hypothetical protein